LNILNTISYDLITVKDIRSQKIECGQRIDAAFWAHDGISPDQVFIFSDDSYWLWSIGNNSLVNKGLASEKWPDLPVALDAACSFNINGQQIQIFLKEGKYWQYTDYTLVKNAPLNELFTLTAPIATCFTCDYLTGNEVGFTSIGSKVHKSLSCRAEFKNGRFEERQCEISGKKDNRFKAAFDKAGSCHALASKLDPVTKIQDFIYFGEDKVAFGNDKVNRFEDVELLIDCKSNLLGMIDGWLLWIILVVLLLIICIIIFICCLKYFGKKYEEDSEGELNEKPAPSITVTDSPE